MTDITLNSIRPADLGATSPGVDRQTRSGESAPDAKSKSRNTASRDTITLSSAAKTLAKTANSDGPIVTDADAVSAATALREQLRHADLSSAARQNQAVLALLR